MSGRLSMITLTVLTFFLMSTSAVQAADNNADVLKLSMEEGKLMVLHRNLDIAIQMIEHQISEAKIVEEKGIFDPTLSSSFHWEESTIPLTTRSSVAAGGRTSVDSEAYRFRAGFSGKLPPGTEYSLEFDEDRTRNTFNDFRAEYDAFAGIRITQPLLRDFGTYVNRFNIRIARKNHDISMHDLRQILNDLMAEYRTAYWDLILAREELKVKGESLRLAESLLDLSIKRLKAEVVSPLEVTQSEAGVASRREDVIIARKNINEKENVLKRLITKDIYSMKDTEIVPTDSPSVTPVDLDIEESIKTALENRPDYLALKTEIEKSDISVTYARNQGFPEIDLEASYGYNGLADGFSDSLKDFSVNTEWTLGVVFTYPLGNRSAGSDETIARLEAEKAVMSLKKLEQQILLETDNAIREVEANLERIEAAKESTRLASESLRAEEIKLNAGLSTSHDLLGFQEEVALAKSREISAIIDYNKSKTELLRVKGVLFKEEGIKLDDNMQALQ